MSVTVPLLCSHTHTHTHTHTSVPCPWLAPPQTLHRVGCLSTQYSPLPPYKAPASTSPLRTGSIRHRLCTGIYYTCTLYMYIHTVHTCTCMIIHVHVYMDMDMRTTCVHVYKMCVHVHVHLSTLLQSCNTDVHVSCTRKPH